MDKEQIEDILRELEDTMLANEAALSLEDVREGTAYVRVSVGADGCGECLVPEPVLQQILLERLSSRDGRISAVEVSR
jgi:hypothetical protein